MLSNHRSADIDTVDRVQGISFSPNSRYIYVSLLIPYIYQYDTWQANLDSSGSIVAVWDSFQDPIFNLPLYFFMHQLAPDGKIYLSTFNGSLYYHVIENPDSFGISCNVNQHSFILPNYNGCIPNFPNYNLGRWIGSVCDTLTGINENENSPFGITVFPNPSTGIFQIRYNLPQNKSGMFEIFDAAGKRVYMMRLPPWSSVQNINAALNAGIYTCKLSANETSGITKLVVLEE